MEEKNSPEKNSNPMPIDPAIKFIDEKPAEEASINQTGLPMGRQPGPFSPVAPVAPSASAAPAIQPKQIANQPETTLNQATEINSSPKNKKISIKRIIIAVVVILLVAISVFYFFRMKKQQTIFSEKLPYKVSGETESWNTYKNSQFGFEIKYPADWKFEEDRAYSVNFFPPSAKIIASTGSEKYPINIWFHASDPNYSLKSQMDRKKYKLDDGTEVIKFFPTSDQSGLSAIVYLKDEAYVVWVDGFVCKECRDIFDKMLPTLKTIK